MTVIKHDEADNARSFDLDREAWVMLVAFPEDLKDSIGIAKAVSGFGIMTQWLEPENLARVIAKVYLNDDAKIPSSVKVNAGLPNKGKSWIVPCFVLKRKSIVEMQDEEAYVTVGPLHPLPPELPRWMGPAGSNAAGGGANSGSEVNPGGGNNTEGWDRWPQQEAPLEAVDNSQPAVVLGSSSVSVNNELVASGKMFSADMVTQAVKNPEPATFVIEMPKTGPVPAGGSNLVQRAVASAQKLKYVITGPSGSDPMITVIPSLIRQVSNFIPSSPSPCFLRDLNLIYLSDDTLIPSYFSDKKLLVHIAFLLHPKLGGQDLEKEALIYLEEDEEEPEMMIEEDEYYLAGHDGDASQHEDDSDLEVLEGPLDVFKTPQKKRMVKMKEPIDDAFLRRSRRVALMKEGFKNAESAKKHKEGKDQEKGAKKGKTPKGGKKNNKKKKAILEPVPLAMIPPQNSAPAPHLPKEVLHGIGTGFLQIQPGTVSAALLDKDDIDE